MNTSLIGPIACRQLGVFSRINLMLLCVANVLGCRGPCMFGSPLLSPAGLAMTAAHNLYNNRCSCLPAFGSSQAPCCCSLALGVLQRGPGTLLLGCFQSCCLLLSDVVIFITVIIFCLSYCMLDTSTAAQQLCQCFVVPAAAQGTSLEVVCAS